MSEPTKEQIEAGAAVLKDHDLGDLAGPAYQRDVAEQVYRAMTAAAKPKATLADEPCDCCGGRGRQHSMACPRLNIPRDQPLPEHLAAFFKTDKGQ